jgi:uncharacterized protein with ParB-like and HNH nuclease domain
MAKIEDHRYTIEAAFRECFYIVPDCQREYVWTEKEVHQLLQDIDEEFGVDDRREYFIVPCWSHRHSRRTISRLSMGSNA